MKKLWISLIVINLILTPALLNAQDAPTDGPVTEVVEDPAVILEQCKEAYTSLAEGYNQCAEVVRLSDLMITDMKKEMFLQKSLLENLEKENEELKSSSDSLLNSPILWGVIGLVVGGLTVKQIQK